VQGKPKFSEKTGPAPLLPITKSHMTRPGFEPGRPRDTNVTGEHAGCIFKVELTVSFEKKVGKNLL
jgi:hypothetical protein